MIKIKQNYENQKGAIMVEAALVFPLILVFIAAMMVLVMLKFQETVLFFGAQKTASSAAREAAYPNYNEYIGISSDMAIDLNDFPEEGSVIEYFKRNELYRTFRRDFGGTEGSSKSSLERFAKEFAFLNGIDTVTDVKITGGLSPTAKVTVEYRLRLPKLLGYLDLPETWTLKAVSYSYAANPTEFVRNIDIAVDVIDFFLDRLGLGKHVDTFLEKLNTVKKKIGG